MPRSASSAAFTRAVMTESCRMRFSLSSMAAAYSASESRPSLSASNAAKRFWTSAFAERLDLADVAVAVAVEREEIGAWSGQGAVSAVLSRTPPR